MVDAATDYSLPSAERRRIMVDRQVRTYDVTDQIVISRMLDVERERFVATGENALAYSDLALDLAGDAGPRTRTMLPPFVLARMMQAAAPKETDRALDVCGGTGYTAALLAGLCASVVTVEPDGTLFAQAKNRLADLGLRNVTPLGVPLSKLTRDLGPFDVIFVNGAAETGLEALAELLAPDGRMVAVVPKPSGATTAALIKGKGRDMSVRPLFDAVAPVLPGMGKAPAFVF